MGEGVRRVAKREGVEIEVKDIGGALSKSQVSARVIEPILACGRSCELRRTSALLRLVLRWSLSSGGERRARSEQMTQRDQLGSN